MPVEEAGSIILNLPNKKTQKQLFLDKFMGRRLQTFCPSKVAHSRIMNALWTEYGGQPLTRPPAWEPERQWVLKLDLNLIPNLGPISVTILRNWLADDDGHAPNDK